MPTAPLASTPASRRRIPCNPSAASNRSIKPRSRCPCRACRSSADMLSALASYMGRRYSDRKQALDKLLQLGGVAAFDHRQDLTIGTSGRVAGAPVLLGLRVEPERVPRMPDDRPQRRQRLCPVVVARVTEDEQRRLGRYRVRPLLPEHVERVAIVAVPVEPHDVCFLGQSRKRIDNVVSVLEEPR